MYKFSLINRHNKYKKNNWENQFIAYITNNGLIAKILTLYPSLKKKNRPTVEKSEGSKKLHKRENM